MRSQSIYAADMATTRYIHVDGLKLAYRVNGPEKAPPLVLAMRFRGVIDEFDPFFLDALAERPHIHPFDGRGVGLSSGDVPDSLYYRTFL